LRSPYPYGANRGIQSGGLAEHSKRVGENGGKGGKGGKLNAPVGNPKRRERKKGEL